MNKLSKYLLIVLLLGSCSSKKIQSHTKKNPLSQALSNSSIEGFKRAKEIIKFNFPDDHSAHNEFKTEWWYFTGNLVDNTGREFGYQFTIFRNALKPIQTLSKTNDWQTNQIYMGHFGLSDIKTKTFYSFEILEREALGLSGSSKNPYRVWVDNWSIDSKGLSTFPLILKAAKNGIVLNLELNPNKEIVLEGDKGLSQKSSEPGNASYYYSIPRLQTKGSIIIDGKEFQVQGDSWMDREWSTSALSEEQEGWDWFALQLSNNTEIMYYQLRNKDGSINETSSGSYIDKNSLKKSLSKDDVKLKVLDYWDSGVSKYPAKWSLEIESLDLNLIIKPLINNQEHRFSIPYWEGAVSIQGSHSGKGYVELTGY